MIEVPSGSFLMGSADGQANEKPVHRVAISSFFMSRYEITFAQWAAVDLAIKKHRKAFRINITPAIHYFEGKRKARGYPVEIIGWSHAMKFCEFLSTCTGRKYRLPTEAEWEYACRAGTTTDFHFGKCILPEVANFNHRGRTEQPRLREVGSYNAANRFGLYDMHGNVAEYCLDRNHTDYTGAPDDGSAWTRGGDSSRRIARGGNYLFGPEIARSSARWSHMRQIGPSGFGLRVVADIPKAV